MSQNNFLESSDIFSYCNVQVFLNISVKTETLYVIFLRKIFFIHRREINDISSKSLPRGLY